MIRWAGIPAFKFGSLPVIKTRLRFPRMYFAAGVAPTKIVSDTRSVRMVSSRLSRSDDAPDHRLNALALIVIS
jgi:hypothetical protein